MDIAGCRTIERPGFRFRYCICIYTGRTYLSIVRLPFAYMSFFTKHRGLKITGIILLSLTVVAVSISFYLSDHYKNVFQAKLPVLAAKATDSLYHITISDFSVNLLTQSITINNLRMTPDSAVVNRRRAEGRPPHVLLDVTVPVMEVSGLKWGDMAIEKEVVCTQVDVYRPKIIIRVIGDPAAKDSLKPKKTPAIDRVFAQVINIRNPEIHFQNETGEATFSIHAKGGLITVRDWDFHPREPSDSSRFFYAKEADVRLEQLAFKQPGNLYTFGMDAVHFISANHTLQMEELYIKPTVSKEQFYKEVKKQKEIYEGHSPEIMIQGIEWEPLITRQVFTAERIDFGNPDLDIYLNRNHPPNTKSKVGNYPHQLLLKLQMPVYIPIMNIHRGSFRYTEVSEKTRQPGTLDFSAIYGNITNATNRPEYIAQNAHCKIKLSGKFMHRSDMMAMFDFPLTAKDGTFSVSGQLSNLQGNQISEAAKALALAEIKSLQLHKMDFSVHGNDHVANGHFTILYNDLKIKLKKIDTNTRQMRNRGFLSMVANGLLLYNDNPMDGQPVRTVETHAERDTTKSFFNLIWRNIFNAGLQTTIRQEGITDLVKKKQANKGKEKTHFFRHLFPKRKKKDHRQETAEKE